MIKGLDKVINNLKAIKKSSVEIDTLFIRKSLIWIGNTANTNLDSRTKHFWGSEARNWNLKIYATYGILENQDMNSASIEFGIGKTGGELFNEITWVAREEGYQYDVPSAYKDDEGRWTFQDARTGIWVRNFSGYKGKSFLYDAFISYMQSNIWVTLYQEAFDEVMRRIIK